MRNVADKICRENQKTHFVFSNFFSEACRLRYNVAGQTTDYNIMRFARLLTEAIYTQMRYSFFFHGNGSYANAPLMLRCTFIASLVVFIFLDRREKERKKERKTFLNLLVLSVDFIVTVLSNIPHVVPFGYLFTFSTLTVGTQVTY
jgi:hypothetical protein